MLSRSEKLVFFWRLAVVETVLGLMNQTMVVVRRVPRRRSPRRSLMGFLVLTGRLRQSVRSVLRFHLLLLSVLGS